MLEKRALQLAVLLACAVPISAGSYGMATGFNITGIDMSSHMRYLSGLLLGIGFGFISAIPDIEYKSTRFRLLTGIVVMGGLGRLIGVWMDGMPGPAMQFALVMELIITPSLYLWQRKLSRRAA